MKRIIWSIIRKLRLGGLMLVIHPKSFLRQKGWFNSFAKKRSLDAEGGVIPWWSYGVIDFIDYRLNAGMSVLEFGSGSSSIWLGQRVRQVITIESDIKWIEILRSDLPDNVHIVHLEKPESLVVSDLPGDSGDFDVLIIDPFAHRINCAKAGLKFLSDEGVVVWDNTDGPDWSEIQRLMSENGFKEISMSGLAPQEVSVTRTTIFYRPNNVFNI